MFEPVNGAFVGAWALASWTVEDASGPYRHPYGERPQGRLIYTAGGQMAVQVQRAEAAVPELESPDEAPALAWISSRFFAYYGSYSTDEAAQTVTHRITGCIVPSWVGTDQVREYRFVDDDRLELRAQLEADSVAAKAGGGANLLVWTRLP